MNLGDLPSSNDDDLDLTSHTNPYLFSNDPGSHPSMLSSQTDDVFVNINNDLEIYYDDLTLSTPGYLTFESDNYGGSLPSLLSLSASNHDGYSHNTTTWDEVFRGTKSSSSSIDHRGDFHHDEQDVRSHLQSAGASGSPPWTFNSDPSPQNNKDFLQWIDGAHRPPNSCHYCRQNRLECLIIKTTEANPNPVTSCSSCVALFRECSLAVGEKRGPAEFETSVPIYGHLHGVNEETNDDVGPFMGQNTGEIPIQPAQPSTQVFVTELQRSDVRSNKQISRSGIRHLKSWFSDHQEYPYPTKEQKVDLEAITGLTSVQITNWFANARRRQRQTNALHVPSMASDSHREADFKNRLRSMSPMRRWENSPPEHDPIDPSIIAEAISSHGSGSGLMSQMPRDIDEPEDPSQRDHASSVSSFRSSGSGMSSDSSAWSYQSFASNHSHRSYIRPQRRRGLKRRHNRQQAEGNLAMIGRYQCTFCNEHFPKKHDWERHEKSIHLPLESWICSPGNGTVMGTADIVPLCIFCRTPNPPLSHLEEHEIAACADRPAIERTFRRKDHMRQHLSKFHGCSKPPEGLIDSWKVEWGELQSRCGFCDALLGSWGDRMSHIAAHFKKGSDMSDWVGDWGFERNVMELLQDVILPDSRDHHKGS